MRSAWVFLAGMVFSVAPGVSGAAASPFTAVAPVFDRHEASPVELIRHNRKKVRRIQRFGGRYYIVERGRDGRIRMFEARRLPSRLERRQRRALANRRALERGLRAPNRTVRRERPRVWEVPKPAEPPAYEPEVAARPVEPREPEPEIALPMPKPEPPVTEFEEFEAAPDTSEQALAREEPEGEINQEAAISCEAAADIVSEFGFSEVETRSCSGSLYSFAAKRDGAPYSIKVDPADGELAEVRKE